MKTFTIGQVTFSLKEAFDFSFLSEFGTPFAVFDKQDSGNLCFGMQKGSQKLFLKLAGPVTVCGRIPPAEAIENLKRSIPVYQDLAHPSLTNLVRHQAVDGGYLLAFQWFDGSCMGKQYQSRERFLQLPLEEKLSLYKTILDFHQFVNEKGYVAVDFYDGCIMYNFSAKQTMLCDIDVYQKLPLVNHMGRMWGSSRYMSPEEFEFGAQIEEHSNVFCMGAAAFELFGGGLDRSPEKWTGPIGCYQAALKAVSRDKADRYPTVKDYKEAWLCGTKG